MEIQDAKQARPHCELIAELLDSRQPKTEREHAAVREIERLRHDIERHIAIASEYATECERLRAELAEWKATTPAPKPDCRTCAHVYTDMESYGCKRSTTIIVCIKGDGYVPSLPVRLYETGGE